MCVYGGGGGSSLFKPHQEHEELIQWASFLGQTAKERLVDSLWQQSGPHC